MFPAHCTRCRERGKHASLLASAGTRPVGHTSCAFARPPQDIQDSTLLWESMPGDVMNQTLQTHNRVARAAAAEHGGYESATGALQCGLRACACLSAGRQHVIIRQGTLLRVGACQALTEQGPFRGHRPGMASLCCALTRGCCAGMRMRGCRAEGDAFIFAFHSADDAAGAALAVQAALQEAEWDPLLLQHPSCAPLYALRVRTGRAGGGAGRGRCSRVSQRVDGREAAPSFFRLVGG